ncbi:hypothetical protein G9A89_019706 [Geosiphon pyriformis]|nr:hypothetical protein G9A89_019706 [Geosiphon pyriformis]
MNLLFDLRPQIIICNSINLDVGIRIYGLLSSIFTELQAIAFALNCILDLSSVVLYTDSQTSLDMCSFLDHSVDSNFCEKYWIEKEHIHSIIVSKNLLVAWIKVKSHSGIVDNKHADFFVDAAINSKFVLPVGIMHHFFAVKDRPVSGNAYCFIRCFFDAVNFVGWESKCAEYAMNFNLNMHFDMH